MFNTLDLIIILVIIMGGIVGFSRGFIKQSVMTAGLILVFVLSYILKNPISEYMYEHLPFFNIDLVLFLLIFLETGELFRIESFVEFEKVFDNRSILLLLHLFTFIKLKVKQFLIAKLSNFSDSLSSPTPIKLSELLFSKLSFSSKEKFK